MVHFVKIPDGPLTKEEAAGAAIETLPQVLIIQVSEEYIYEVPYGFEFSTAGKYMKLFGTIQGDEERQWAHFTY